MLSELTKVPVRFYQLALLNIGLIIALSKDLSLLYIIGSLLFVAALAAPIALYLGWISSPPITIIQEEVQTKISSFFKISSEFASGWSEKSQ